MIRQLSWFSILALTAVMIFFYLPMIVLVAYSFNASEFINNWAGFSFRWYITLFRNGEYWDAAWTTLQIATVSSILATILGVIASLVLSRFRWFTGRSLFSGMMVAPMVLPEVITGLSLLLLFIALGVNRGMITVIIAHTTFSMCFVSVIISARMAEFDLSIEEAARDLGANPVSAFFLVTVPVIFPAIVSGFLMAFTISLDSLVISSFTTGPGTTTLPVRIYSEVRRGIRPEINALSSLIILVATITVIIVSIQTKRKMDRLRREAMAAVD